MNFLEFLQQEGKPIALNRGEHVFRQGDTGEHLYLITSGLLKATYLSPEGSENIKSFYFPGEIIGSLKGFVDGTGCSFSLVCLEDSTLNAVHFGNLRDAIRDSLVLSNEVVDFLLKFAMKKENREFELLCLSPEARYRRLLESNPVLLEKVPQNEIALFLGVTPVGLSRIKKRVSQSWQTTK